MNPRASSRRSTSAAAAAAPPARGSQPHHGWHEYCDEAATTVAGELSRDGVVALRRVLPPSIAAALATHVDVELEKRKHEAAPASTQCTDEEEVRKRRYASERWFGAVRDRRDRYDLRLSAEAPAVRDALQCLCSHISSLLEEVVTLDAFVVELSALVSDPGAIRQPWHPDSLLPSLVGAPLYTCFVALQNVTSSMGPTRVLPGTHTEEFHRRFRDDGYKGRRARQAAESCDEHMACECGDAFLMDSRLWHCGGSNQSGLRRRLLYVSFGVPHCVPAGSTYSILDEYKQRLRVRALAGQRKAAAVGEAGTSGAGGREAEVGLEVGPPRHQ